MREKKLDNVFSSLKNRIYPLLIFFVAIIMGIGYAATSVVIDLFGSVVISSSDGVFISDVTYKDGKNIDKNNSKINSAYDTLFNSEIELSSTTKDTYITYTFTVINNTDFKYTYVGAYYNDDFYSNKNIIFEESIKLNDTIASKSTITFDVTFKYDDKVDIASVENVLSSCIDFRFLRVIDYIESTGTQYIDTGVKPNDDTTFEMSIALNDINSAQAIYGTRDKMDGTLHNVFVHNNNSDNVFKLRWDEDNTISYADLNYNVGSKIYISKTDSNITFESNGSSHIINGIDSEWSLDSTAYIFSENNQSTPETRHALMKLYYLKMYQNGTLIRDFIPIIDEEGKACLYDLITNKYYHNIGTGDFSYETTYKTVDFIKSSGSEYIITDFTPTINSRVEFVMSLDENYTTSQAIFGARVAGGDRAYGMFLFHQNLRWDYSDTTNTLEYGNNVITNPLYISAGPIYVSVNGIKNTYNYTDTIASGYNLYLFAMNESDNPLYLNAGMKLYFFRIYENGALVRNFIPSVDANGRACLYDIVTNKAYYNANSTGSFTYQ